MFKEYLIKGNSFFKEVINKAVSKFSYEEQLNQMQEESAELIVAINKLRRNSGSRASVKNREELLEELADNIILIEQMLIFNNVTEEKFNNVLNEKLRKLNGYL